MIGLNDIYFASASVAAIAGVVYGGRKIQKVDKAIQGVAEKGADLKTVADTLTAALGKQHERSLTWDVESYSAVEAANRALQQVIADSTKQLALAATQVAQSTDELRKVRAELETVTSEKAAMRLEIEKLKTEVAQLKARLEYFTNPPPMGQGGHTH